MSAYGMTPKFSDWTGYQKWKKEWIKIYSLLSGRCRRYKKMLCLAQRANDHKNVYELRGKYHQERIMAYKMMTMCQEGKKHWNNIKKAKKSLREQNAEFPLTLEGCRIIEFHYNKKSIEWPWIPMWVVKTKGKAFYVNHIECNSPWTTRENPDSKHTKGSLRIKHSDLFIDKDFVAHITPTKNQNIIEF